MSTLYPYAQGDLLTEPNTYFYTPYHGQAFLDAWSQAREDVLKRIGPPSPPPRACETVRQRRAGSTNDLLEHAHALVEVSQGKLTDEARAMLEKFRAKFEITKRVHQAYDEDFRAVDPRQHKDLTLYVRAAELFEAVCARSGDVIYLNVLLKIIDTLCAFHERLSDMESARLAWLIERERIYVDAVDRLSPMAK